MIDGWRGADNFAHMALPPVSRLLQQFVDDELLRAPMVYDQLVEATADAIRRALPAAHPVQRGALADLSQVMLAQRARMADYCMRSLGDQVKAELARTPPGGTALSAKVAAAKPKALSLVDEDTVAIDVELSHAIETIKSEAEYELRELQTFVSALVGDLDMSADHNPFRAEAWARAVWDSAQAMPLSRSHQVAFMRHASKPLAQLLRTSYAASTSRLEGMGVEPAAYRTMILPSGSRRGARGGVETTFTPDLYRMSETMPAPLDSGDRSVVGYQGQQRSAPASPAAAPSSGGREHWSEIARGTTQRADRQAIELVSRLFEAMLADTRVPPDVTVLISRLHGPAMRLALRDRTLLDHSRHPLWRFINLLVFAAQMSPDASDPERVQLLRLAQATIDQLSSEPVQNTAVYRWALERLESFLAKRTQRRLAGVATQIGALQKLEAAHAHDQGPPSTMSGPLDHHQLDTVPAEFMDTVAPADEASDAANEWLTRLKAGDWVRMFFQGRWVQAQLLWPGERREFFLFGDGASDATWAVRRNALILMYGNGLAKTLKLRSIVGGRRRPLTPAATRSSRPPGRAARARSSGSRRAPAGSSAVVPSAPGRRAGSAAGPCPVHPRARWSAPARARVRQAAAACGSGRRPRAAGAAVRRGSS